MSSDPSQQNTEPDEVAELRARAEQGDAGAQFEIGMMYSDGRGVPQDDVQAMVWYCRAAEHRYVDALFALGAMYLFGQGVPQDYVEAHAWMSLAAVWATGSDKKRYEKNRTALAELMTPAEVAEARTLARAWTEVFEQRTNKNDETFRRSDCQTSKS